MPGTSQADLKLEPPGRPQYPFSVGHRDILHIALPASVAFITEPVVGLVDIVVIGRLGDAGLLGGLVLGALAFDVLFSLASFLRIGTAGLVAQAVGAKDARDGLLHVSRAMLLGAAIGIVMILLAPALLWLGIGLLAPEPGAHAAFSEYFYWRIWSAPFALVNFALLGWFYGRARTKTGMMLQMMLHGVDIALSVVMVHWLGWGVPGAAIATVIAQALATLLGTILLTRHYGGVAGLGRRLNLAELGHALALDRMFGLSRDLMIRSAALMGAYAWFAAQGSRMGEITLSANAVLLNLLMVAGFFLDGIAQAAEQLTGKAVGANWRPAFDRAYKLSMGWGLALGFMLGAIWLISGTALIGFITTNADVRDLAVDYLPLAALAALTFTPAFVLDGIMIGATLNRTMRNGMIASLGVFLAAATLLQPALGNAGLWVALHCWFLARGGIYWWALEQRRTSLFGA